MEPLSVFLLIVGCSEDLVHCTELPAPAPVYESAQVCEEDLPRAVRGHMQAHDFPQLLARCIPVDPALEEQDAEIVWDITPEGHLMATVEPLTEYQIASEQPD